MTNPAEQLAVNAAKARKLVKCQVESSNPTGDGGVEVTVSGSLDVDVGSEIAAGGDADDLNALVSNMRLQVTVKDGKVTEEKWLR